MSALVLWVLGLLCAAPAFGAVNWLPAASAPSENVVRTGAGRLCRAMVGANQLVGYENNAECVIAYGSSLQRVASYELAVGLVSWQDATPPESVALVGGQEGGNPVRPCLTRGVQSKPGWSRALDNTCVIDGGGVVTTVTEFDLLYEFNLNENFLIYNSDGRCIEAAALPTDTTVRQVACGTNPWQQWRIRIENDKYVLGNSLRTDCLTAGSGTSVAMASCATSAAPIRFEYVDEHQFRIRFANGNYATSRGVTFLNIYLGQTTGSDADTQRFAIRSVPDAARRIKVMSYNVMLLSGTVFPGIKHTDRVNWLVPQITSRHKDIDVFVFQEVFDEIARGRLQDKMADAGYPYMTELAFAPFYDDAGVVIQSRYPIEVGLVSSFPATMCSGADCLARKGVVYARVNKLGRRYHIFGTHLQAGDDAATRREQLVEMRNLANIMPILPDEPVLMAGDFNIDMEGDVSDYNYMLNVLRATFPNAPRPVGVPQSPMEPRYTSDSRTNDIKRARGGTDNKWLDYIFAAQPGPQPLTASWEAYEYEHSEEYGMNLETAPVLIPIGGLVVYLTPKSWHYDLSDHYSLLGSFTYAYGAARQVEDNTVPITFSADLQRGSGALPETFVSIGATRFPLPTTLRMQKDAQYPISVAAPSTVEGTRYQWTEWSHGAPQEWTLSNFTQPEEYRAYFRKQHEVKVTANPKNGGTVSGAGWYEEAVSADIVATPAPGYRFTGFSGSFTSTRNPERVPVNRPVSLVANFEAIPMPTLYVTTGSRTGTGSQRSVQLVLANRGQGAAQNARITSITTQVTTGSGTVNLAQPVPIAFGTIQPGSNATQTIAFEWPTTATRVRLTIGFAADNGYSGSTTLNLFR
jgi:endonuclease/exonuclease/phosphatase family metal-dependent hydrolase